MASTVAPNSVKAFRAIMIGAADQRVTWSVVESDAGNIVDSGLYSAPGTEGTYHVKATSVSDPTKSATATVVVSLANTLSLVSTAPGAYTIMGNAFTDVQGINVIVTYDATRMTNPQMTQGAFASGSMFVANTIRPGTVRFAIISVQPISGTGPLATLAFDSFAAETAPPIVSATFLTSRDLGRNPGTVVVTPATVPVGNTSAESTSPVAGSSENYLYQRQLGFIVCVSIPGKLLYQQQFGHVARVCTIGKFFYQQQFANGLYHLSVGQA